MVVFLLKIQLYHTLAQFLVTLAQKNTTNYKKFEKSVLTKKSQPYQTLAQSLLDPR